MEYIRTKWGEKNIDIAREKLMFAICNLVKVDWGSQKKKSKLTLTGSSHADTSRGKYLRDVTEKLPGCLVCIVTEGKRTLASGLKNTDGGRKQTRIFGQRTKIRVSGRRTNVEGGTSGVKKGLKEKAVPPGVLQQGSWGELGKKRRKRAKQAVIFQDEGGSILREFGIHY